MATIARGPADAALRGGKALAKRLLRSAGTGGARLLYKTAARKALKRLQTLGLDESVALHIAEHFTMVAGKVSHSVFEKSLRSTRAITELVTEVLKKGSRAPVLSVTDTGALAWVFEGEMGRVIGNAGGIALTKLRVVVDLKGRLVTAFPIENFLKTISSAGMRVTTGAALAIVAIEGVYEDEAYAATKDRERFEEENEPSWWEYLLPWGESSRLGYEPNYAKIGERADAAVQKVEEAMGEKLSAEQRSEIRGDVKSIWTSSPAQE